MTPVKKLILSLLAVALVCTFTIGCQGNTAKKDGAAPAPAADKGDAAPPAADKKDAH